MVDRRFILEWNKVFGWNKNPFQDKVLEPVENFIAGFEKERSRINLFIIKKQKLGFISGGNGSGKTILLKWLYNELEKYSDQLYAAYIDAQQINNEKQFLDNLVNAIQNPFEKAASKISKKAKVKNKDKFLETRVIKKRLVLMLDNFNNLTRDCDNILQNMLKSNVSLILAVEKKTNVFQGAKDSLNITLPKLKHEEIKELLSKRIEYSLGNGIHPFDDKLLHSIEKSAGANIKKILELCHDRAVKMAVSKGSAVTPKPAQKIVEQSSTFEQKFRSLIPKKIILKLPSEWQDSISEGILKLKEISNKAMLLLKDSLNMAKEEYRDESDKLIKKLHVQAKNSVNKDYSKPKQQKKVDNEKELMKTLEIVKKVGKEISNKQEAHSSVEEEKDQMKKNESFILGLEKEFKEKAAA